MRCILNCRLSAQQVLVWTLTTAQPRPVSTPAETRSGNLKYPCNELNYLQFKIIAFVLRLLLQYPPLHNCRLIIFYL